MVAVKVQALLFLLNTCKGLSYIAQICNENQLKQQQFPQIVYELVLYFIEHFMYVGDDDNESPKQNNEKKKLEDILREKEDTLRKLKLVKMYRAKV